MLVETDFTQEKSEVAIVLASGVFDRSPTLAQLLSYICSRYFEGTADQLKEYTIGVEALGKSTDFDPKKDSIVRVQVHRLRDRLAEYYNKDGATHAVKIVVPQGHYTPRFEIHAALTEQPRTPPTEAFHEPASAPVAMLTKSPDKGKWRWWLAIAAACALAAGIWLAVAVRGPRNPVKASSSPAMPSGDSIRILCGLESGSWIDGFGNEWLSDRWFEGGTVADSLSQTILGTREQRLYQSRRQGTFHYDVPLKPGVYELRLHFAETNFGETNPAGMGGEGSRAFSISFNDRNVVSRLDVIGESGVSTADVKVFRDVSPAADGKLHIAFGSLVSMPFLNAIEITPGIAGRMRPVRLVERDRGFTDTQGTYWTPDRYAIGGQLALRKNKVTGDADPELFRGERFGNLTWVLPVVPNSKYDLTVYMAEQWLGPNMPGRGGENSRLFDILCNGVALMRDFDVYKRAGGANRPLTQTFRNLAPNHQGKIVLSMVPNRNFPIVNALALTDASK